MKSVRNKTGFDSFKVSMNFNIGKRSTVHLHYTGQLTELCVFNISMNQGAKKLPETLYNLYQGESIGSRLAANQVKEQLDKNL